MATVTSVGDGYWDQAGTWDVGVPTINDDVVIAHTVTIRDENAVCLSVTINAGKQLVFECSGGATKITFKDDATAKIVNNGTITIQNTTATKKCTWKGGSSTNKVDWQTQGTFNPASYWHLEYVRFSFDFTIDGKKLYVDKDIWTQNFQIWGDGTGFVYVAAGVTWMVGRSDEDGQDELLVAQGVEMQAVGTAGSHILFRGYDDTHRMLPVRFYRALVNGHYIDFDKIASRSVVLINATAHNYFYKCAIKGVNQEGFWLEGASFAYLKECSLDCGTGWDIRFAGSTGVLEECTIAGWRTLAFNVGIIDLKSTVFDDMAYYDSGQVRHYRKLTLTVQTGGVPLQGAYCTLVQDHAEDYRNKDFKFSQAGYTDANGQVVLWALWKVELWKGYTKETIYYSDENNNGPSGTKEKHLLKIVKENYWPSQDRSYYMSQDRTDTITLIPLETPGAERVIKFGTFQFPHVQSAAEVKKRGFVEKFIPDRQVAYRKDIGGYGRSWRISGYIDIDIWNTKAAMAALADGTARSFDRGTGEALVDCIMLDPEFPEDVDRYGRLGYTVTLMEQSNP